MKAFPREYLEKLYESLPKQMNRFPLFHTTVPFGAGAQIEKDKWMGDGRLFRKQWKGEQILSNVGALGQHWARG